MYKMGPHYHALPPRQWLHTRQANMAAVIASKHSARRVPARHVNVVCVRWLPSGDATNAGVGRWQMPQMFLRNISSVVWHRQT